MKEGGGIRLPNIFLLLIFIYLLFYYFNYFFYNYFYLFIFLFIFGLLHAMCMRAKLPELLGVHLQLSPIPKTLPSLLDKRQNPSFRLPDSGDAPTIPQRPQH